LHGTWPKLYDSFNLLDCFKVEKSGTNTLIVGGTIYKMYNEDGFRKVNLPSVSIQVLITQADLDSYRASMVKTK